MAYLSPIIAAILGTLVCTLITGFVWQVVANRRKGAAYRDKLKQQIDDLRLGRMVEHQGVEKDHYLHQTMVVDIKHHIDSCSGCQATSACDQHLSGQDTASSEDFCPNVEALQTISNHQKARGSA